MHLNRKKVYFKIFKRKNKQYLTLIQRHKRLFENQLVKFVPNQSTPINKKYDAVHMDKNKLFRLVESKGLNPAPELMTSVFDASNSLKKFSDVLAYSQTAALMGRPSKYSHKNKKKPFNPYLTVGGKKSVVVLNPYKQAMAARNINRVLRACRMKTIEGVLEWPDKKKVDPRITRKHSKIQVYYSGHIGPKGLNMYWVSEYRDRNRLEIAKANALAKKRKRHGF
jgi:hypothetical protein